MEHLLSAMVGIPVKDLLEMHFGPLVVVLLAMAVAGLFLLERRANAVARQMGSMAVEWAGFNARLQASIDLQNLRIATVEGDLVEMKESLALLTEIQLKARAGQLVEEIVNS